MKELHLQFVQMAEVVRMNNHHGRKMLITEKHRGHDLTLLKAVFKLRKHPSVYQISSFPLATKASLAHLSSSFRSHSVSQQSTAGSGAGDLVGG